MFLSYAILFLISAFLLAFSSRWIVGIVSRIGLFLRVKEFVIGFFVMAFAVSLPNFFVGLISAFNGASQLSFGDVIGGNIVDLSIVIGLAVLVSKGGISADSRTVQGSSIFTIIAGTLPLFLIYDRELSRVDGLLLILSYFIYVSWLFSKKDRFSKVYNHARMPSIKHFLRDLFSLAVSIVLLLLGAAGIVKSALFFAEFFNVPLGIIGLFVVGVGNCLPETFFCIQAARKNQDWMILGDLMGGVVVTATLVLGIVSLISPIEIIDFSPFAIARIFLVISALFFFFSVRNDRKISKKEAILFFLVYIAFIAVEVLTK